MSDYVYIGLIVILVVVVIGLIYYLPKAKEKGAGEVFALFLSSAFEDRVNWFKTMNKYSAKAGTVFVGDSITNEYLLTEMLPGYNVHNRGIGGDTSDGVLKRLKESVFDLEPTKMFLMIGTNDLVLSDNSLSKIAENIDLISSKCREELPNLSIYLVSLCPVCEGEYAHVDKNTVGERNNKDIRELNGMIEEIAMKKGYSFINLYSFLADDNGDLRPEFTREGLHLSHLAYEKITEKLQKIL